jgi:hypothetical protein
MPASFTAYIDESGDEGFVFQPNEKGSSRWLVLSAVIFRKNRDLDAVKIMKEVRAKLGKDPKRALHFSHLKHEQRIPYLRILGESSFRSISILIHKPSIEDPEIFRSEGFRLYRYASRLLLERMSWLCRDHKKNDEGDGSVEITFSNRSAMSYDDLRNYLNVLKDSALTNGSQIDWNIIDITSVKAINHDQLAGLQIADAIASGIYYGVNLNQYGEAESRYVELISPTLYKNKGVALGYGLKFWPKNIDYLKDQHKHLSYFETHK